MANSDDFRRGFGLSNRMLKRRGVPWIPLGGEVHHSRLPREQWEPTLRLMSLSTRVGPPWRGGCHVLASPVIAATDRVRDAEAQCEVKEFAARRRMRKAKARVRHPSSSG